MAATITVTAKEMVGKRIWLLVIVDDAQDTESVMDAKVAERKPESNNSEWWRPASEMQLSGIFNGRDQVTLSFDNDGQLTSVQ